MGIAENEIEICEQAKNLLDWRGNTQDKRANVLVRQAALCKLHNYPTNDIGFLRSKNGSYEAIMDDGFLRHMPKWVERLTQFYGVERAKAELIHKKIRFVEDITDKNCPRLRVRF
jgi:hypothetical protein